jgi:uncharacterized protein (TIGR03083 family)
MPVSSQTLDDVLDDLLAEQDRLEAILSGLAERAWQSASGAAGWTVTDVVLHLAQTEEAVVATSSGADRSADRSAGWGVEAGAVEEVMDRMVAAERAAPVTVFQRWRTARHAAITALRRADPQQPIPWVLAPAALRNYAT